MDWRALAAVALAVTAGCGGLAGAGGETPTVTPAPVPEPDPDEDGSLAPGLAGGGVIDVDRLARAHSHAIDNESYVYRDYRITNSTRENRTADTRMRQRLRVEHNRNYHYWTDRRRTRIGGRLRFLANYSEYVEGDVGYARYVSRVGDGVNYARIVGETTSTRFVPDATSAIRRYLAVEDASVAVVEVDGQRHYEVTGARDRLLREGAVENYTVTAVVRPDGFVRSLNVTYVDPEFERRVVFGFRYTDLGETTVERPDWVRERWFLGNATATEAAETVPDANETRTEGTRSPSTTG